MINPFNSVKFVTDKYAQLIEHQGWEVKWEQATKCPCYNYLKGESTFNCPVCHDRGVIYSKPADVTVREERATMLNTNTLKVKHNPTGVLRIFNKAQLVEYTVSSISNNEVTVTGSPLQSHFGVFVDYSYSLHSSISEVLSTTTARPDELVVSKKYISAIVSIRNTTLGENLQYEYYTDNIIKLTANVNVGHSVTVSYTYINPIKMIISGTTEMNNITGVGEIIEGDIMVTFPYYLNIGERDRLTISDNDVSTRYNDILTRGRYDKVRVDQVIKILEVRDLNRRYTEGVDFKLTGARNIEWIVGGASPDDNSQYSIVYLARKEYIVWQEIWQERHTGNIFLPRRLIARRFEKIQSYEDRAHGEE